MKRIAILGGGISGLTAAYELEKARRAGAPIDWHLYEASDRLGGIVETTRIATPAGEYILEGGPDGWVSEKPWARDLAIELGLEADLIHSNDATRKTYVLRDGSLLPIPDRMRLMVPEDLAALDASPLFSASAKQAYATELTRAAELKAAALPDRQDESVASFVRRHFGDEVTRTLAAPLLAGVFGGDVDKLSVRAVMPQMLTLEREHGSLIAGLQARAAQRGDKPAQPIFTSLRRGMASLTEALVAQLPPERLHLRSPVRSLAQQPAHWQLNGEAFEQLILALNLDGVLRLLGPTLPAATGLLPTEASSAVLVALTWSGETASTFTIPRGFGFLVPPTQSGVISTEAQRSGEPPEFPPAPSGTDAALLACTFVDQKFPHRAPAGARILRAFFGGPSATALQAQPDAAVTEAAITQLRQILGPLPAPEHAVVRRWPRSLPQYEVGHLDRIARLEALAAQFAGLHLLGNSYHGVGLPDLIRGAQTAVARILRPA